jgi:hypothetical protein
LPQTVCVNAAQESMNPVEFPSGLVRRHEDKRLTWVEGLAEALRECYAAGRLPSEIGIDWAKSGKTIDTREYNYFAGF